MLAEGALWILRRSVAKQNLHYTAKIADSDSSAKSRMAAVEPYGCECPIKKQECAGHVQNCLSTS